MVYLIHFKTPFKHAKHYIGFVQQSTGLDERLNKHKNGSGSRLLRAVSKAGIEFSIVRVWPDGSRDFERSLKNKKATPRLCPCCKTYPQETEERNAYEAK